MKSTDKGCTTRISLEVNTGWMKDSPILFQKAFLEFVDNAIQLDLFDVNVDIDRVGFVTFTATAMPPLERSGS
jgi:hypothetical protein